MAAASEGLTALMRVLWDAQFAFRDPAGPAALMRVLWGRQGTFNAPDSGRTNIADQDPVGAGVVIADSADESLWAREATGLDPAGPTALIRVLWEAQTNQERVMAKRKLNRMATDGADTTHRSETVVRAFELPVGRVERALAAKDDKRTGWDVIRECWQEATCLANWAVTELIRRDVTRTRNMEKLPKMAPVDLYALMFGRKAPRAPRKGSKAALAGSEPLPTVEPIYGDTTFWKGACISASTIINDVRKKYDRERLNVLWHRKQKPCFYTYPYPWPVHASAWKEAGLDESGKPWVLLALPGGWVRLRLRGGPEFGRQMGLFRQVVEGKLPRIQLVIRQQGASPTCHRSLIVAGQPQRKGEEGPYRPDGEMPARTCRVMVKMVASIPVRERPGNRALTLLTDPGAFWVAELDGRRVWILNNDHFVRGVRAHQDHLRALQRLGEDAKAERRLGSNRTRQIHERMEILVQKDRNRMASWTHETAAHLAGFAVRQKVGFVLYRDLDQGFCARFPWHRLKTLLQQKLQAAGIASHCLSDGSPPDDLLARFAPKETEECPPTTMDQARKAGRRLLKAARRSGSHRAVSAPPATAPTSPSLDRSMP